MSKVVYTLKIKKGTQEMHLFEATPQPDNKCTPCQKFICNKMDSSERAGNKFACSDEVYARKETANIGRGVRGICVSHLYPIY